jgi:hypothetical protein
LKIRDLFMFCDYCCTYYFFSSSIQLLLLMSSSDLVLICGSLEDHPGNPRMVNPCDGKYSRLSCLQPQSPFSTLSFFLFLSSPESPISTLSFFLRSPNSQLFLAFGCSSAVRVFFFFFWVGFLRFAQLASSNITESCSSSQ